MKKADDKRREGYDKVSARWRDKMHALGYFDAYLGFLSAPGFGAAGAKRIIDVGAGTGAFSEAWVAINGAPETLVLLDPSRSMLERAGQALAERGVHGQQVLTSLEAYSGAGFDEVLAAHVIEHFPDPLTALGQMRDLLRSGGRLRLVVSKPHWCNALIWLQWRHRTFGRSEIDTLIRQAGFHEPDFYTFPSGPPSRTSMGISAIRKD